MKRHENGSFVEGEDEVAWLDLRCLRITPNPTSMDLKMFRFAKIVPGIVLQSSSFSQLDHLC